MSANTPTINRNPERQAGPEQRFDGVISKVDVKQGPDHLEVTMLDAEIGKGDLVIVDGKQPENPAFGKMTGITPIAQLKVGGIPEEGVPVQNISVYKVRRDLNESLRRVITHGLGSEAEEGFLVSVSDDDPRSVSVKGFTFISPSTGFGVIGRSSNLAWADGAGIKKQEPLASKGRWTPFNESVSRHQLTFTFSDGNLMIRGESANSPTSIRTRASAQQQAIVKQAETVRAEQAKAEAEKAKKAQKLGNRVLSRLQKR